MATRLTLTWHPNLADARLGFALASWGTRGRLARTILVLFAFPGLALGVLSGSAATGMAFGLLFGLLFLLAFPALFGRQLVRRQLDQASVHEIVLTDEGMERTLPGTVICHPWSAITRVLELPSAFLLFRGAVPIASIEKSAAPDAASVHAVRALIASATSIYTRTGTLLAFERRDSEA